MSRTRHGSKGPGYEYWSRRGYPSVRMACPGRDAKIATNRAERRADKLEVRRGIVDYEDDCHWAMVAAVTYQQAHGNW